MKHFPGLEKLIIRCKAHLQCQYIPHGPLNQGTSDPSNPPPPQQIWSCRWFCHRGVVVFLALIQNRCREGGFGHPPAPAAHVLPDTWINPFPACSTAKLSSQAPIKQQITNLLLVLFLCMCILLCLTFALRNNQEQIKPPDPWQGSESKPGLQPEVCRPHCSPGTGKNFAKKHTTWFERASLPAAE